MPYIPEERRPLLARSADVIHEHTEVGDFTYFIYRAGQRFLGRQMRFTRIAFVLGSFLCVIFELYRRRVVPYEERKREENGDVY